MAWIEIDAGVYALEPTPDPVEVVVLAELDAEIAKCRAAIAAIEAQRLATPKDVDAGVIEAVRAYNETAYSTSYQDNELAHLLALRVEVVGQ